MRSASTRLKEPLAEEEASADAETRFTPLLCCDTNFELEWSLMYSGRCRPPQKPFSGPGVTVHALSACRLLQHENSKPWSPLHRVLLFVQILPLGCSCLGAPRDMGENRQVLLREAVLGSAHRESQLQRLTLGYQPQANGLSRYP